MDTTKFAAVVGQGKIALRCEVCNQGPADGVTVYRANAKGQSGIWRCGPHRDTPTDPEVQTIVSILEEYGRA
jgi:hypothetical protein